MPGEEHFADGLACGRVVFFGAENIGERPAERLGGEMAGQFLGYPVHQDDVVVQVGGDDPFGDGSQRHQQALCFVGQRAGGVFPFQGKGERRRRRLEVVGLGPGPGQALRHAVVEAEDAVEMPAGQQRGQQRRADAAGVEERPGVGRQRFVVHPQEQGFALVEESGLGGIQRFEQAVPRRVVADRGHVRGGPVGAQLFSGRIGAVFQVIHASRAGDASQGGQDAVQAVQGDARLEQLPLHLDQGRQIAVARLDGLPGLGAVRDVVGDDQAGGPSGHEQGGAGGFRVQQRAVLAAVVPVLARRVEFVQRQAGPQGREVLGRAQVGQRQGKKFFPAVAVLPDRGGVDGEEAQGVRIEHPHGLRIGLEELAVAFLVGLVVNFGAPGGLAAEFQFVGGEPGERHEVIPLEVVELAGAIIQDAEHAQHAPAEGKERGGGEEAQAKVSRGQGMIHQKRMVPGVLDPEEFAGGSNLAAQAQCPDLRQRVLGQGLGVAPNVFLVAKGDQGDRRVVNARGQPDDPLERFASRSVKNALLTAGGTAGADGGFPVHVAPSFYGLKQKGTHGNGRGAR